MNTKDKFIITRWLYSILEEPLMTDHEYNALLRNYIQQGELLEYTSRSWSDDPCPTELLLKYNMPQHIYKIKNTEKTESMASIVNRYTFNKVFNDTEANYHVSFKEDGINVRKIYYNGKLIKIETRGRSSDALDFSNLIDIDPNQYIPLLGEVHIIGEMQLSIANLQVLREMNGKDYKFPRTSVRAALASKDTALLCDFHAFDIKDNKERNVIDMYRELEDMGFKTPQWYHATTLDLYDIVEQLSKDSKYYGYVTDGVVVRSNIPAITMAVRLFSWEEEIYISKVVGVEESFSDLYLGCKLLIYPTRTETGTQRRINITNIKNIISNKLYPDSPIAFTLRSGAIADIDLKTTKELQEEYEGRYDEYSNMIRLQDIEESIRRFNGGNLE